MTAAMLIHRPEEDVLYSPGTLLLRDKPEYVLAPHLLELDDAIVAACVANEQRFILNISPVRHGKSLLASIHTAAWYLLNFPYRDVGILCYNADLAAEYGEAVRDIVARWGPHFGITISKSSNAKARFRLLVHNRQAGQFRAVGLAGTLTGRGFHLLIGDDLVKNREEADSKRHRDRIWSRWNGTVRTRLDVHVGTAIIVNSRWHQDDIVGRLERASHEPDADQYQVIHRPALAIQPADTPDVCPYTGVSGVCSRGDTIRRYRQGWTCPGRWHTEDGRLNGEALWPWRYNRRALVRLRAAIGDREFAAQLQGTPVMAGAGTVNTGAFRYLDRVPSGLRWVWAWDRALSDTGDWTAGALLGRNGKGQVLVAAVARIRTSDPDARDKFIADSVRRQGPKTCPVIIETEGSEGKASARQLVRAVKPHTLHYERPPTDRSKLQRAEPFFAAVNRGEVFILRPGGVLPSWFEDFKDELDAVPVGVHDDMWDAAGRAFAFLDRGGGSMAVPAGR